MKTHIILILSLLSAFNQICAQKAGSSLKPSGTLPALYLNTENGAPITSKEEYINATFYIDAFNTGYNSTGTAQAPVATKIRGRGNYTWSGGFEKLPYRLKMNVAASLLGMTADRNYNLLAHADDKSVLRDIVGFELSRRLKMAYSPGQIPVEFVLNGNYIGLYFLTDQIRVSKQRVNIMEQNDLETDSEAITGGWLLEIDNYEDPRQVSTQRVPRFTYHSPEILSPQQSNYIKKRLQAAENALYATDKNNQLWESFFDVDAIVNFYIIQEITGNTESFHGSCFFYKDRGTDAKFFFGPVWDFGNAFQHGHNFIYVDIWDAFSSRWITEFVKFPRFQQRLMQRWHELRNTQLATLTQYVDTFAALIAKAQALDYQRWPQYAAPNYPAAVSTVKSYISDRLAWLDSQWQTDTEEPAHFDTPQIVPNPARSSINIVAGDTVRQVSIFSMQGKCLARYTYPPQNINPNIAAGTYIVKIQTASETVARKLVYKR